MGGVTTTVETHTCYVGSGTDGQANFTRYEVVVPDPETKPDQFAVGFYNSLDDSCSAATLVGQSDPCPVGRCCASLFYVDKAQVGGFLVTRPASPSPAPHKKDDDDGFPTYGIVLIVIAAVIAALAVVGGGGWLYVKRKRSTYEYIPSSNLAV